MKKRILMLLVLTFAVEVWGASTISSNTASNSAYGANIGWINWQADGTNGAVIGDFVCSGNIYAANVGWINLGDGTPDNGFQYGNATASDLGVNHDGVGNLRGHAYGANIGWINFEDVGNPRINLRTGVLDGYIWGANVGWISLSNVFAVVKSDSFFPGRDKDEDGIPDQWEYSQTGKIEILSAGNDEDGDGLTDVDEYLADTDPLDPNDNLRITAHSVSFGDSTDSHVLIWTSRPTRFYKFNFANSLNPGFSFSSVNVLIAPNPGSTTKEEISFGGTPPDQRFFSNSSRAPASALNGLNLRSGNSTIIEFIFPDSISVSSSERKVGRVTPCAPLPPARIGNLSSRIK